MRKETLGICAVYNGAAPNVWGGSIKDFGSKVNRAFLDSYIKDFKSAIIEDPALRKAR